MIFKNTVLKRSNITGYMPRYISQKDKYNCGPVAIINYWKYLGLNVFYKDVKILSKILKTEYFPIGTYYFAMGAILGTIGKVISISKLKNNLPAIIVDGNHYWFCAYICSGGFIVINYSGNKTYHFISTKRMKSILKKSEVFLLGENNV